MYYFMDVLIYSIARKTRSWIFAKKKEILVEQAPELVFMNSCCLLNC